MAFQRANKEGKSLLRLEIDLYSLESEDTDIASINVDKDTLND
jgi:hypothetical protein